MIVEKLRRNNDNQQNKKEKAKKEIGLKAKDCLFRNYILQVLYDTTTTAKRRREI